MALGTGASRATDGVTLEGQHTLSMFLHRLPRLHEFTELRAFTLKELADIVHRIAIAETLSQNTMGEGQAAFRIFAARDVSCAFLFSSPTHLRR